MRQHRASGRLFRRLAVLVIVAALAACESAPPRRGNTSDAGEDDPWRVGGSVTVGPTIGTPSGSGTAGSRP
jgi:hypothetical protein